MPDIQQYNVPTSIVIFGGTGDLVQTKLFPSLFNLYKKHALPSTFTLIGISRKEISKEEYQNFVRDIINKKENCDQNLLNDFCKHIRYVAGDFDNIDTYDSLKIALQEFDAEIKQCTSKLFYLAVPPNFYSKIFNRLKESDAMALCDGIGSWSRLLVEKPFGHDLKTAIDLEKQLQDLFSDDQIYRIDHYLAKDAIENIISLRFANSILSDSWNNKYIESVNLRLLETKDVSNRGSFYEDTGTLRDVGQNHILQMLALLTMNNVDVNDSKSMRESRALAIRAFSHKNITEIVRGQYKGFTGTSGVNPNSQTETYFKIKTEIDNFAWSGVTFILESGKALNQDITDAVITFKSLNKCYCGFEPNPHEHKNILTITFAPEQLINLVLWVKKPGFDFVLEKRELELVHAKGSDMQSPEAYERVLFDCIVGNQTRFVSGEEVTEAWKFITPILETFETLPLSLYEIGTAGPVIN